MGRDEGNRRMRLEGPALPASVSVSALARCEVSMCH